MPVDSDRAPSRERPAVFLDRDGVLTDVIEPDGAAASPRKLADFAIASSARAALEALRAAGYALFVITNQPDVARGTLSPRDLDAMHAILNEHLPLDGIYACCHDNDDRCRCRKPRPGLVLRAAAEHAIDLSRSWLIGDRWTDMVTAAAAGVEPVLLERPWSSLPTSQGQPPPDLTVRYSGSTLAECTDFVLTHRPRAIKERT